MATEIEKLKILVDIDDNLTSQFNKLSDEIKRNNEKISKSMGDVSNSAKGASKDVSNSFLNIKNAIAGVATGAAVKAMYDLETATNQTMNAFTVATGNAALAKKEFDFISDSAKNLGLNVRQSALDFSKFAVAAKGTSLEGESARKIFLGVSEASAALGLSSDQAAGALNALQQMVSKGNVQAEELRGQLGERIPGAFNMAAKSMGVTTEELNKMLDNGEVLATELLPKLAEEMHKAYGETAQKNAESLVGKLNDVKNSTDELIKAFLDAGGREAMKETLEAVADGLKFVKENIDVIIPIGKSLFAMFAAKKFIDMATSVKVAGLAFQDTYNKNIIAATTYTGTYGTVMTTAATKTNIFNAALKSLNINPIMLGLTALIGSITFLNSAMGKMKAEGLQKAVGLEDKDLERVTKLKEEYNEISKNTKSVVTNYGVINYLTQEQKKRKKEINAEAQKLLGFDFESTKAANLKVDTLKEEIETRKQLADTPNSDLNVIDPNKATKDAKAKEAALKAEEAAKQFAEASARRKAEHEKQIQQAKELTESLRIERLKGIEQEKAELLQWYNEKRTILTAGGEDTSILVGAYAERVEAIEEKYRQKRIQSQSETNARIRSLYMELNQAKVDALTIGLDGELAFNINASAILEQQKALELERLRIWAEEKKAIEGTTQAEITYINEIEQQKRFEISQRYLEAEKAHELARQNMYMDTLGNFIQAGKTFAGIRKKDSGILKALTMFEIGLNTSRAVMSTFAQFGGFPMGVLPAAAMAAIGAAQLTAAANQKFERGGIVGGSSFTGDSQIVRVNSGEMFFNQRQQKNLYSMINSDRGFGRGGGDVTFGDIIINVNGSTNPEQIAEVIRQTESERLRELRRMNMENMVYA